MMTMKPTLFLILPALTTVNALHSETREQHNQRPNIILILADDMGYSDIGCYGGEISTPNLDQLAAQGIRFTQFYNAARCCPSRASLLTGVYPHESGIGHMTHKVWSGPVYQGYLNNKTVTLAEVLGQNGYSTNMVGKWHVGTEEVAWPSNRGFHRFYGIHSWVDSYYKVLGGCDIYEDGKIVLPASNKLPEPVSESDDWYTTDVFTRKALEYIDKSVAEEKPFFLYTAYNSPHWPLEAPDSTIRKYLGKYNMGWKKLMQEKLIRMKKMGIMPENTEIPYQEMPDWDSLSDSIKLDTEFRRAIYAAQIEDLDINIGRLVSHLKERGIFENTVIIFLSDNGCSAEPEDNDFGYNWGKNTRWNYNKWKYNSGRAGASQGRAWSIASNTPFRMYKKFIHEGGISTPLIVSYPAKISSPGSLVHTPGFLPDIMATCIDLAGAKYPKTMGKSSITPLRGHSLVPIFENKPYNEHEFICWEHENHGGIREGDWKLVTEKLENPVWELYNISVDRTEATNLATSYPEKVTELKAKWDKWAAEVGVFPKERIAKNK
jgi:arylsulfatase A-like enzyme